MNIRTAAIPCLDDAVKNIAEEIYSEANQPNSQETPEFHLSRLSIIAQEYNIDETRMKFSLMDNYGHIFTLTAAEISANDAMIHALSKRELNMISYVAGYETSNATPDS